MPNAPEGSPRILVVVNVFHPDRGGGAAVFSDLCFELADRGLDVTVRCAYPYYPEWSDKWEKNGWSIERYEERGVKIERYGLYLPEDPSSLPQRLLYEGSFFLSLLRSLPRSGDYDAVLVYCPLVGAVAFASAVRMLFDTPVWLNVQDLSAEAARQSGMAGSGLAEVLASVQRLLFNRADVWSSISPVMLDTLRPLRERDQPLLFLPNWLHASLREAIEALPEKRGRTPETPVKLLYGGNIGEKQGLLRLCRTLAESDAEFALTVHGSGGRAEAVRRWIEEEADERFRFGPFLPEDEFAEVLHETDLFLIPEKPGTGGSFIPSKMIPGMASQTPVLAVCDADSPLGREMREHEPGEWFAWDRTEEIPELLNRLPERADQFVNWQENAIDRATFYDRDHVIDRIERLLRQMAADEPIDLS